MRAWSTGGDEAKFKEFNVRFTRREPVGCLNLYRRLAERGVYVTPHA
jgi:hypothetical protein